MNEVLLLDEIALKHGTDKASRHPVKGHGYTAHYADVFWPFRDEPLSVVEIGVGGGESIRMWLEYFPRALVYGVDNVQGTNPWNTVRGGADLRYTFVYGDQSDTTFWECFKVDYGPTFDIIIDDGGHFSNQIVTTFAGMWGTIKPGGFYCIEDIDCGYTAGTIFIPPGSPSHNDFVTGFVPSIQTGGSDIDYLRISNGLAIFRKR